MAQEDGREVGVLGPVIVTQSAVARQGRVMRVELVNLRRSYLLRKREVDVAVGRVLRSGRYILGREVESFETEFARFCGAKHCVAVASGTDALILSLRALGIGRGDEVITVANSFISTALSISILGAAPVFVDVDERTHLLDAKELEAKITPRTKAVIPVHLFGQPADMDAIRVVARRHKLAVLEDACQAHGARYRGRRAGTLGDIAAFSFYPSKNLGGFGDGGAVVTNSAALARQVRLLHTYGWKERDRSLFVGVNSRLDELQAAALRVKLRHLEKWNTMRREHAARYRELLSGADVLVTADTEGVASACHLFVIRSRRRDALATFLKRNGISTGIHYPIPIHLQPVYAAQGHVRGELSVTEMLAGEILSLPLFPELAGREIAYVARKIKQFCKAGVAAQQKYFT